MLWLWYRPAAAVPIRPIAWELPCAVGAALKKKKKRGEKKKNGIIKVKDKRADVN